MSKKLREVLRTKANWCKGTTRIKDGRCCLVGACGEATLPLESEEYSMVLGKLQTAVKQLFPDRTVTCLSTIAGFNDHSDTTFEDVCRVIEEAGV